MMTKGQKRFWAIFVIVVPVLISGLFMWIQQSYNDKRSDNKELIIKVENCVTKPELETKIKEVSTQIEKKADKELVSFQYQTLSENLASMRQDVKKLIDIQMQSELKPRDTIRIDRIDPLEIQLVCKDNFIERQ